VHSASIADAQPLPAEKPLAVTIEVTRRLTGLGATTIWKLVKEKRLRTARVGGGTLVIYRSIEEVLGLTDSAEN